MMTTFTMLLFYYCGVYFGPAFGMLAVYQAFRNNPLNPRRIVSKIFVGISLFIFGLFCAYIGWFISGIFALRMFPDYPRISPGELLASTFALPGFITGVFGIVIIKYLKKRYTLLDFAKWFTPILIPPTVLYIFLGIIVRYKISGSGLFFWITFTAVIIISGIISLNVILKSSLNKAKIFFIPITVILTFCQFLWPFLLLLFWPVPS